MLGKEVYSMDYERLWEMEKSFWLDGPEFYERSMAPNARMIFPGPVGILADEEIVEGLRRAPRWKSVEFNNKTGTKLCDTAVIAYEASGQRDGDDVYKAFCASTYVCKDGTWKLLAHQQTLKG
jgi:hypothetical protein